LKKITANGYALAPQKVNSVLKQRRVYRDPTELAQATAELIAQNILNSIFERGICYIAFSGGETPRIAYRILSENPRGVGIDWSKVQIYFVDERMVPPNDTESNFLMVEQELLSRIKIPQQHIHRIHGELDAKQAGDLYDQELRVVFVNATPKFDLILLGVGEDGHTASLFPGTDALHATQQFAVANFVPAKKSWRVTLTLPVINNARNIIFLVSGVAKSQIISTLSRSMPDDQVLPASLIHPTTGNLEWMLDAEAASLL
jgi:6-phosphogluconolactonase